MCFRYMEMHWMLVSFTMKVSSPHAYWSQARMVDEILSTTSTQCHLGNKYSPSCILFQHPTLCRLHHGMKSIYLPLLQLLQIQCSSYDTCCFPQRVPTISFPLVIFVMLVLRLISKFIIIQYENIELWAMILNKHHMCILYEFSFGY